MFQTNKRTVFQLFLSIQGSNPKQNWIPLTKAYMFGKTWGWKNPLKSWHFYQDISALYQCTQNTQGLMSTVHTIAHARMHARTHTQVHTVISESWPLNTVSYFCTLLIHGDVSLSYEPYAPLPSLPFRIARGTHTHARQIHSVTHTNTHDSRALAWRSLSHG